MALPSTVVEQSTSKLLSVMSTKLVDNKASRSETIARIEIAVYRIHRVIEKTGKIAMTDVSLLQGWNRLKLNYIEGMKLLNKYKAQQELDGQGVMVRSFSYFQRFAKRAANLSIISSLVSLVNEDLSPSVARSFERLADFAENKFEADVESAYRQLRNGKFRYPFLRHLFQGKTLWFAREKGKQHSCFVIWPVILEGRGVEALLGFSYFDPNRLEKSFLMWLMIRISESTDIIGTAINCLRSSASLLNPVAQDAAGQLTELHNFQDIAYSDEPLSESEIPELYPGWTKFFRANPLCCQAGNGHEPRINSIISSELSQIFPEQTILFTFECYLPMLECRLASASDKKHRNAMVHRLGGRQPPVIRYAFAPHYLCPCMLEANSTIIQFDLSISNKEGHRDASLPLSGNSLNIKENIDHARRFVINFLTDEPEATDCVVRWISNHGCVLLKLERPRQDIVTVPKARGRYETRSAKKRKM